MGPPGPADPSASLRTSRIFRELRQRGYQGGPTALYRYLRTLKGTAATKATVRFETGPGEQGQFDWSPYTIELGGQPTRVILYGTTLGYSRRKHYSASLDEQGASIYEAIEASFWHFGGAPKVLLVDPSVPSRAGLPGRWWSTPGQSTSSGTPSFWVGERPLPSPTARLPGSAAPDQRQG